MTREAADLIVLGGTIHTLDAENPSPEAVAVRGDRFVYAGSRAGAVALRDEATRLLDLRGATVLPGLVDAHIHVTQLGLNLTRANLVGSRSLAEVIERTAAFARASDDSWILGDGWDQNLWDDDAFPVHGPLSATIADRPVALARVDRHAVLANARAMAIAGVDASTPDPTGGRIVRDAAGSPTGLFVDAAQALVYARVPPPTHDRLVRATRAAIRECNRWGITAVAEPGTGDAEIAAHVDLMARDEYTLRTYAIYAYDPASFDDHLARGRADGAYGGRLWTGAVKMYADGALGSRGAALLAPYADDAGNCGLIVTPHGRIVYVTEAALRAGFQVCTHAIGDRANRMVLDAYETALRRTGPGLDHRLRVEHAQVVDAQDVPRFARLGVIASVQTSHQTTDMAWVEARLGSERATGAYAWRSLLDAGATIANGTDAPVEPVSTPRTFYAAISRQNDAGDPRGGWHPQQRMTRHEALASMTAWAARANFQEHAIGSIEAGKYADFVVVDRDWMIVGPEEVLRTQVVSTYFGGCCVYEDASSRPEA